MDIKSILKTVDHTLLSQTAVWEDIKTLCDDGLKYSVASVCIPPSYVRKAYDYLENSLPVCTVIGFPNGYSTAQTKCCEALDAVKNGASEIDMVINIGFVKSGDFDKVLNEIRSVRAVCEGKTLKVIIETCLLSEEEKITMCKVVSRSGADFIKTSTGFAGGGATREDVALLRKYTPYEIGVKASGGIKTLSEAEDFILLGASRLGTSRIVAAARELELK